MLAVGKVYIVGAGPGDPELITKKAIDVLKKADVVIYDHLIPVELLDIARDAQKIYVGKEAGRHTLSQDEINVLMLKFARECKVVVRLKGGDPFIFGRGGEECEFLRENSVDFEVVPGVSSFYSALAYAGIPVTHRDFVSSFAVATGSEADKPSSKLNFDAISKSGTIVFMMTVRNLPVIVQELLKFLSDSTPCAIVENGTTPYQKVVTSTLGKIVDEAKKYDIKPPAIFAIGEVVKLREKIMWFENKKLFGKSFVITRPVHQTNALAELIRREGGEPIIFPSVKIEFDSVHKENIRKFVDDISNVRGEAEVFPYHVVVFTSQNGVELFFSEIFSIGKDARIFAGCHIAAVGEKTAQTLLKFGIRPDVVPRKFTTSELCKMLSPYKKVFMLRAEGVRNIEDDLVRSGKDVINYDIYRVSRYEHSEREIMELMNKNPNVLIFASALSFSFFCDMFPPDWVSSRIIACIGDVTADEVRRRLKKEPEIISQKHTIEALFDQILKFFSSNKH